MAAVVADAIIEAAENRQWAMYLYSTGDTSVEPEAQAILNVFKSKNCRIGDVILFWDFGDAIQWEAGFIKDEGTRNGLRYLIENGYVDEYFTGLRLAEKGGNYLNSFVVTLDPDIAEVFTSSFKLPQPTPYSLVSL